MKVWFFGLGGLLVVAACILAGVSSLHRHMRLDRQLVVAVNAHDAAQAERLLTDGANPNARDWLTYYEGGGEPYIAPWYEKPLATLQRHPPREGDGYLGPTLLMVASYHGDLALTQSLLAHGADVRLKGTSIDYDGDTEQVSALYEAMPAAFMEEIQDKTLLARKETISLLLIADHAPVNDPVLSTTLLHIAAVGNQPRLVTALLDNGAEINALNSSGETPLVETAERINANEDAFTDTRTATLLLARGAEVNHQDNSGDTALMHASNYGLTGVVRLLLIKGANIRAKNKRGETALKIAEENDGANINNHAINTRAVIALLKHAGAK